MIRAMLLVLIGFFITGEMRSQSLEYYLANKSDYDATIPTPESIIGHPVGAWHLSHDRLTRYLEAVAESSDRVRLEQYGVTYEGRPLYLLIITSPENQANLASIQQQHLQLTDPAISPGLDLGTMPVVVWIGYSIHGNEASGVNASPLTIYHLAAAQGAYMDQMLENTIILIDPSINPDGMNRFASWVNSHRSKILDKFPHSLEHQEAWPTGRTNHYWFDLNRDWLPVQHPETRGRLAEFHNWRPNILTDHHEMGSHRTFFFQPGVPSRNHPLTPENTFKLTAEIANYHAKALDEIGSLYYSGESFDDFYYGKGSTYPDINGAIGILFEQASTRGHIRDTQNGTLKFPFAIKNQLTTSLSTLQAAQDLRVELLEHQRNFYLSALELASKDPLKGIIFKSGDQGRMYHFLDILRRHQVEIYQAGEKVNLDGGSYSPQNSFIIPMQQRQYRLIKALFEQRTNFQDSLFYDVSAWTLPLAFDIDFTYLNDADFKPAWLGNAMVEPEFPKGQIIGGKSSYGYVFDCNQYYSYRAFNRIFVHKLSVKVATEPMAVGSIELPPGSVLIPVAGQTMNPDEIFRLMNQIAEKDGITVRALSTGHHDRRKSWGSPTVKQLKQPKIIVLAGEGVNAYEVGEVWHLLDQRYEMEMTMVSPEKAGELNLNLFNTLVLVSGNYNSLGSKVKDKLKLWVEEGGQIITWKSAAKWLSDAKISTVQFKQSKIDSLPQLPYASRNNYAAAKKIGGAILEVNIDLSHPLGYGIDGATMPIFKNSGLVLESSKNPFTHPVMYTDNPLLSGYVHSKKLEEIKNTPAVEIAQIGKGRIIAFADNPNFRAFWYGTNRLFMNSLFYGPIIEHQGLK